MRNAWIGIASAVVLCSIDARADYEEARGPVVPVASSACPVSTLEQYDAHVRDLRQYQDSSNLTQRNAARMELEACKQWYVEHVHLRSPALFGLGLGLLGIGGASFIIGTLVVTSTAARETCISCSRPSNPETLYAVGGTMMLAGAGLAAVGVPLFLIGGKSVVDLGPSAGFSIGPTEISFRATF